MERGATGRPGVNAVPAAVVESQSVTEPAHSRVRPSVQGSAKATLLTLDHARAPAIRITVFTSAN